MSAHRNVLLLFLLAALGALGWAFWPMLVSLQQTWEREPDYSHGYLVLPIALYCLWTRRHRLEGVVAGPSFWGLLLVAAAAAVRLFAIEFYLEPVEYLSFLLILIGAVWTIMGTAIMVWALPATLFLVFLFPMPFRIEQAFSQELQRLATKGSCWLLQTLGEPAFALGNVIQINDNRIEVVQACSGLRMMMSFLALSCAFVLLSRRSIWENILIILSAVPIAVACNILRITTTGLLYAYANADWAHKFTHDVAGWAMMPVGLVFLMGGLWYLDNLFIDAESGEPAVAARGSR